jgi:ABC-2 type transport system permease protein
MLLALIRKELLSLSRDIHGLAALFVLPVMFIIVMSMALKDVYSPRITHLVWSAIDEDKSEISAELLDHWEKANGKPIVLPSDWEQAVREGRLNYLIRIAKGANKDIAQTTKPEHAPIELLTEPSLDFGVYTSLSTQLQALTGRLRLQVLISALPETMLADFNNETFRTENLVAVDRASASSRPTSVQHNVPAWLVFGMFFVVTSIAGLFVEERHCGALNRLFSFGVSPLALLSAKIVPFMLINGVQAVLMLAVGIYFMPLLGGDALSLQGVDYLALLTMLFSISLAATSLALLVATLVRSQAQASAIGPMMNVFMAALGGIMVPTFVMPPVMQNISQFSPMNWALEGLLDVLLRGGGLSSISVEVTQLVLLAVCSIGMAYFIFRVKKS